MTSHPGPASCLCGGVTWEITAEPFQAFNCHCKLCRKAHGSAFGTYWFMHPDEFRWTGSTDTIVHYRSSHLLTRSFCDVRGSKMPRIDPDRGIAIVPLGALDDDPGMKAADHIFVADKCEWHDITDELPVFEKGPVAV